MSKLHRTAMLAVLAVPTVQGFISSSLGLAGTAVLASVTLSSCEGKAEKAGEKIDNAVEKAGDKIENATDKK